MDGNGEGNRTVTAVALYKMLKAYASALRDFLNLSVIPVNRRDDLRMFFMI
jgi:hypothetical protein